MDKLYIVICPSVSSGRSYADYMGWKEVNCAFITGQNHLQDVSFQPNDTIHVLMPVDETLWQDILVCSAELKTAEQVKIHLVKW